MRKEEEEEREERDKRKKNERGNGDGRRKIVLKVSDGQRHPMP